MIGTVRSKGSLQGLDGSLHCLDGSARIYEVEGANRISTKLF